MLTLIRNANLFAPAPLGLRDVLIADGRIAAIDSTIELSGSFLWEELDASGKILIPGLVDSLVHITGGGGEGGPHTRVPPMQLSQAVNAGVTTLIGALGTDSVSRSLEDLVAKARALSTEGISAYCHTGSYQVPVKTLTGSIERDLLLVDVMLGTGEIAVADNRSSQPTLEELKKIVAASRVGGMLSGKAGTVLIHMGDAPDQLTLLDALFASTDLPKRQLQVTHINRSAALFEKAIGFAQRGGYVDFTTSTGGLMKWGEVSCAEGLQRLLQEGVPVSQITFSSDGQASLPIFDAEGQVVGIGVGEISSLWQEVKRCVSQGMALEVVLPVVTSSPAKLLGLSQKGVLATGKDADLLLLNDDLSIDGVMARGRWLKQNGVLQVKGTFES
ncbi:beta-aspartyl-peptidase [Pokkaliibacter sp. CJK22405]|uniref:beta-aspartyl-peptidase n=1 Tax=Pokkaliibacter sp. CJK22405 TaxID=3384615 RepID=UPI00398463DB